MTRKKFITALFCAVLCCCAAGTALASAGGRSVIQLFRYSRDSYTSEHFTKTAGGEMPAKLDFEGDESQGVGAVMQAGKSGSYSVTLSVYSGTDGNQDFFFVLGNPSPNSVSSVMTANCVTIGRTPGAFILHGKAGTAAKFYAADGVTEAEGNFVQAALGDWASNQNVLYRFDVLSGGDINVYYDFAGTDNALSTLRNIIRGVPAGAADGYFSVVPHVNPAESETGRVRSVDYVTIDTVTEQFLKMNEASFLIAGDTARASIATDFFFYDDQRNAVASNFAFSDKDLADGETVFDISFVASSSKWGAVGARWGMLFGMSSQNDTEKSESVGALVMEYASTSITLGNGSAAIAQVKASGSGENATPAYLYNSDCRVRLVGKKGGTLDFYRQAVGESIETLHSTYTGLNFNGHAAFYCQDGGDSRNTDYTRYQFVNLLGNVSYSVQSVNINRVPFTNAEVGSVIDLSSKVVTYPQTDSGAVYTITGGKNLAELVENGTKLLITGDGEITVRATSAVDPTKYDEVTFRVAKLVFERYTLKESFAELNECDWNLIDGDGNVTVNEGIYIEKDFADDANGSAKMVSNVQFVTDPGEDTVFDITFKSELLSSGLHRDPSFSWGILFGMKDSGKSAGDPGVGYFQVNYVSTQAYLGADKVQPVYRGGRNSENCDVYCEAPLGYTVRLVGLKNGTLNVYRGYSGYEKITDLFASYAGFDFNGYVAFTTKSSRIAGSEANNDYSVRFTDIVLDGNVIVDGNYEVKNVKIDTEAFRNAIVSDIPLQCSAVVNALPNLNTYRGVSFRLISGPAVLNGDRLTITGAGRIKIRATSKKDDTKYAEYEFEAIRFTVTAIEVDESVFENVTNDSQPLPLIARLTCNSLANEYQRVVWTVLSGNAEVAGGQLRITGIGEVKLRVVSVYAPESRREFTFTVADADEGKSKVDENGIVTGGAAGLGAGAVAGITAGAVAFTGAAVFVTLLLIKKKKKKQ